MAKPILYQFSIIDLRGKHKTITEFAKDIPDLCTRYAFGADCMVKAVAGWRIKKLTTPIR